MKAQIQNSLFKVSEIKVSYQPNLKATGGTNELIVGANSKLSEAINYLFQSTFHKVEPYKPASVFTKTMQEILSFKVQLPIILLDL